MNVTIQSKSISNLTQIFIFFGFFYFFFHFLLNHLRKYHAWFQDIPEKLHVGTVIRLISSFHAILSTILSLYTLYYDKELGQNKLLYTSFGISFILSFSIGFLAYDFIMMLTYPEELELGFVVHHFVSIVAFYACLTEGVFPYIALYRLSSEGSTPFVNNRWFLLTMGKKNSKLYVWNGVALVIVFALVRISTIIPIWSLFFSLIESPAWNSIELKYKLICVFSSAPLDLLNVFWFSKIIKILVKSLRALVFQPSKKADAISEKNE